MAWSFSHIGIIGKHRNPLVAETIQEIATQLSQWRLSVSVESESAADCKALTSNTRSLEDIAQQCDLAIAVGGDGNLLTAAREFSLNDVPVIGINRGQLGFLTDIKPEVFHDELKAVLQGNFIEEKRFLLEGRVERDGKPIGYGNALNDVVLYPGEVSHLIEFELRINDQFVYSQRSDGIIVATPTGSTAYALSAGGPIINPGLDAMVLVPKLPHTLTSRPIVIGGESRVTIVVGRYDKCDPQVSFDAQNNVMLNTGDQIHIHKQTAALRLIHPKHYNYFKVLRNKLDWGKQLVSLHEAE